MGGVLKTIICDKCNKPLETETNQEVEKNKQIDIVMDKNSIHRREWQFDLCTECAEIFDLFLKSFKDYIVPIYKQLPYSDMFEDYSDDEIVNQAVDVWGGAGPDCSSIRVAPVERETLRHNDKLSGGFASTGVPC